MDGCVGGWMNGGADECVAEWIDGRMGEDECMGGWVDGWMHE